MALKLAKNSGLTDIISMDGTNPLTTQHSVDGGIVTVQVYLFNDDATKKYTSISVDPIDVTGSDESSWISLSLDGTTYQSPSAALSIADINDSNVAHSFWVKISVPSGQTVQNKTDIKLQVSSTEFAV